MTNHGSSFLKKAQEPMILIGRTYNYAEHWSVWLICITYFSWLLILRGNLKKKNWKRLIYFGVGNWMHVLKDCHD